VAPFQGSRCPARQLVSSAAVPPFSKRDAYPLFLDFYGFNTAKANLVGKMAPKGCIKGGSCPGLELQGVSSIARSREARR